MRRLAFFMCACLVVGLEPAHAQAPATRPQPQVEPVTGGVTLPVQRVVLYKNGVGYFEHLGRVRGSQSLSIDFTSTQLDDALKTLTALDLGNGRVSGISYNSEAPLGQRLGALRLPLSDRTTLPELLAALRGTRLEVRAGARVIKGRLLGVERRAVGSGPTASTRDELTLVSDTGEIRTVELSPAVTVKLAERDSAEQVGSYLGLLASTGAPDRRRITISTIGTGDRDVLVSYISEVPIWKTSYRLVLPADGEAPLLLGWAIVDNTTGADWTNVEMSLVAGAPQSFIQHISQPLYGRRPVVQPSRGVLLTPQSHDPTLTVGAGTLRGTVRDGSSAVLPGTTVRVLDGQRRMVAQAFTDSQGGYSMAGLAAGAYRLEFLLSGFQTIARDITIAANGEATESATLRVGSIGETVTVSGESPVARRFGGAAGGVGGGVAGGVIGGLPAPPPAPGAPQATDRLAIAERLQGTQADAAAQQLSDLFEYRITSPISIARNSSALVPILNTHATVERVSLWNNRVGAQPLRAMWLTNATGLTLDGGSFMVIDSGVFAGEGLLDPLKPDERRLLSYAVDLGLQVESHQGDERRLINRITVQRGVVIEQREQRTRRVYTIRNNDTTDRVMVIEHPTRVGWKLRGHEPAETSAAAYRFKVNVPAKQTTTFTVDEAQPLLNRYEISALTDDQFNVLVSDSGSNEAVKQALLPILEKKATISTLSAQLANQHQVIKQIADDEQRIRENLRALKDTSEAKRLVKRYAEQLTELEDRLELRRGELASTDGALTQATTELRHLLEQLAVDVTLDE